MTPPVVILPPSAALGVEVRSKVERQALFHVAGTNLWARNGAVVRLRPLMSALVLALAAARGRALAYGAAIDAVHGDDPEGGPLNPLGSFKVIRSLQKDDLAALGVNIEIWHGCGYVLRLAEIRAWPGGPERRNLAPVSGQHWLACAVAMRERGATFTEIADAVDRHVTTVRRACLGVRDQRRNRARTSRTALTEKRQRLRKAAEVEAAHTGRSSLEIQAEWDCAPLVRSRIWDQRRAAASEARP